MKVYLWVIHLFSLFLALGFSVPDNGDGPGSWAGSIAFSIISVAALVLLFLIGKNNSNSTSNKMSP